MIFSTEKDDISDLYTHIRSDKKTEIMLIKLWHASIKDKYVEGVHTLQLLYKEHSKVYMLSLNILRHICRENLRNIINKIDYLGNEIYSTIIGIYIYI